MRTARGSLPHDIVLQVQSLSAYRYDAGYTVKIRREGRRLPIVPISTAIPHTVRDVEIAF